MKLTAKQQELIWSVLLFQISAKFVKPDVTTM